MIRATTTGLLKSYRSNLMGSFINLKNARDTVLTKRNFNSYAEDPSSAAQCFQLRRSFARVNSQLTVSDATKRKYDTAYSALESVVNMIDNEKDTSAWAAGLRGENGPTGAGRKNLGQELRELAESIVQTMNTKYGDTFTFAGADGLNVPFTWAENADGSRTLQYRGVSVDMQPLPEAPVKPDGEPVMSDELKAALVDPDDYTQGIKSATDLGITDPAEYQKLQDEFNTYDADMAAYKATPEYQEYETDMKAYEQECEDIEKANKETMAKLNYLADEKRFVDIGIGLSEGEDGKLIEASAFNDALSGIKMLGYGTDSEGLPDNIVSIIDRMGEIMLNCDERTGDFASTAEEAEFNKLLLKFDDQAAIVKRAHSQMTTEAAFLKNNTNLLKATSDNLNEQFIEIEQADMADAITSFSYAQYCYNAALKMGNSILSQSLMDYLN